MSSSQSDSTLYVLATGCRKLFLEITTNKDHALKIEDGAAVTSVEDLSARFLAWGTNIAALHDSHRRTSLDFRLRQAPDISERARSILEELSEYLTDSMITLHFNITSGVNIFFFSIANLDRKSGKHRNR